MKPTVYIKIWEKDRWVRFNKKRHANAKIVAVKFEQALTEKDFHVLNSFKLHTE